MKYKRMFMCLLTACAITLSACQEGEPASDVKNKETGYLCPIERSGRWIDYDADEHLAAYTEDGTVRNTGTLADEVFSDLDYFD